MDLQRFATRAQPRELEAHYPYLNQAVPARRLAHHAGRVCAAAAIAALGYDRRSGEPLARGSGGEPIWPEGIVGSITHTRELACAVAAPVSACAGIGIDSEECVDEDGCQDIAAVCLSSAERQRFLRGSSCDRRWTATAMFCIKEAFYKAAYPHVRRFVDFEELAITHLDMASGSVQACTPVFGSSSRLRLSGKFVAHDRHVHACVALHAAQRPLIDPSRLHVGESHARR